MSTDPPHFLLIDHSLQDLRGHHFPYALNVLQALRDSGQTAALASHRGFAAPTELSPWRVYNVFEHPSYSRYTLDTQSPHRTSPAAGASPFRAGRAWWVGRNRGRLAAAFAGGCARLFAQVALRKGATAFIATASELDLAGLALFLQQHEPARSLQWHLQFHFGIYRGREPQYSSQHAAAAAMRDSFLQSLSHLRGVALHFWCTTEALTAQYQSLGVAQFATLPYPVHPVFSQARALRVAPRPVRIACLGHPRREKGRGMLPSLMRQLWPHLASGGARFIVQGMRPALRRELLTTMQQLSDLRAPTISSSEIVEFAATALDLPSYARLLAASDIGLLLYDPVRYYDRCSGILLEMLVAGVPVIVPAACWLDRQIHAINQQYLSNLASRAANAVSLPLTSQGGAATDGTLRVASDQRWQWTAKPQACGATLLLSCLCRAPQQLGSYLRFQLSQRPLSDASEAQHRAVQIIAAHASARRLWLAFRLQPHTTDFTLECSSAWDGDDIVIEDLRAVLIGGAPQPLGAVGCALADISQAAQAVDEVLSHLAHYKTQAAEFSLLFAQRCDARRIVELLGAT